MSAPRFRLLLNIILIVLLVALSTVTAYAQEDEGPIQTVLNVIRGILEFLLELIRGFFDWLFTAIGRIIEMFIGIANWLVTAIGNIIKVIINFLQPLIDLIAGILRIIGELVQIVVLILQIVVGFFILLVTFAFQAVGIIVQIIGQFFAAPSTAIPGLPQCVTDPTSWQLCAGYYILDWTLFAPSTPGAIIVPLVVILVDVKIVFFFIRKIMSILNIGEKVTDV